MRQSSTRRGRVAQLELIEFARRPKQWIVGQIVGLLIRLRAELFVTAAAVAAWLWLGSLMSPVARLVTVSIVVVAVFGLPWSRRFVVSRVWCVLDRHRLRSCLLRAKVRTMNLDGSLPWLLWARPTKTGERVWLWMPAGSAADDIDNALPYIASACYARDAGLHLVRKLTTLVAVDVIRRDPLAKSTPILSPLAKLTDGVDAVPAGEGDEPIRAATITDITTLPVDGARTVKRAAGRAVVVESEPERVPGPRVTEDYSDYIDID